MIRRSLVLAAVLSLYACGGDASDAEQARSADPASTPAPSPSANPQAPGQFPDDSLEMANARLTRARQASMSRYTECMAQGRGVPEQARRQIEEACSRLPDAPK